LQLDLAKAGDAAVELGRSTPTTNRLGQLDGAVTGIAQLVIAGEVEGRLAQRRGVDGQGLVIQLVHKLRIPLRRDDAGAGLVAAGRAIGIDGVFPFEPEGQGAVLCPCALAVEALLVIALQDIADTLVERRQAWVGLPAGELGLDVEACP